MSRKAYLLLVACALGACSGCSGRTCVSPRVRNDSGVVGPLIVIVESMDSGARTVLGSGLVLGAGETFEGAYTCEDGLTATSELEVVAWVDVDRDDAGDCEDFAPTCGPDSNDPFVRAVVRAEDLEDGVVSLVVE